MTSKPIKRALVLSGGGARGAYEAGVLRYILRVLPDSLPAPPRFDIICGASVGAINAAWLAATINDPRRSANQLDYLWRSLVFSEVVKFSYREVWRIFRRSLLEDRLTLPRRPSNSNSREGGFLKTSFFDNFLRQQIPFATISENLAAGYFEAVSVTATDIITGRTTAFVQSKSPLPPWTRDARRIAVAGPITLEKVLGSAAIPLLFPSVKIDNHWYSDGGLRQNTPISPALRLGADRVLVVALKSRSFEERIAPLPETTPHEAHPNQAFILGKVLDALLLDPLDYDLSVLERLNAILEYGEEAFGEGIFVERLNKVIRAHRGQGYRYVHQVLIRPSKDLGEVAAEFAQEKPPHFWGSFPLRMLAERALEAQGARESDFLSYVLFDGGYAGQLVDLGYRDATARHDELVEFFSP